MTATRAISFEARILTFGVESRQGIWILTQLEIRILVITTGTLSRFSAQMVSTEVAHDRSGGPSCAFVPGPD